MLSNYLTKSRQRLDRDLADSELRWMFSPSLLGLRRHLIPIFAEHITGAVLDVGCGNMPYREYLNEKAVEKYEGFDIEKRSPDTKFIGDAQLMSEIPNNTYDTVVSFFALEHMPRPWEAFAQMVRVCKPGGTIVLAVPHLSRLHEEPHDYFRFTNHGLRAMGEQCGLTVLETHKQGGLFTFLGHQASTAIVCALWPVPILKWIGFWINYLCIVQPAIFLDFVTNASRKFPVNVVAVYQLPKT